MLHVAKQRRRCTPCALILSCLLVGHLPPLPGQTDNPDSGTRLDTDAAGAGVASSCQPQVAIGAGSRLQFAWQDFRGGQWRVVHRYAASFGAALAGSDAVLGAVGDAFAPRIATNPALSHVYVVWRAVLATGEERIYFTRSTDNGQTWPAAGQELQLSLPADHVGDPQIAVDGAGTLYVVWHGNGGPGDMLYLARSANGGASWPAPVPLTIATQLSVIRGARLVTDGQNSVYVAFLHTPNGATTGAGLWFYGSNDNGQTWPHVRLLATGGTLYELALAASATGHVHVAWSVNHRRAWSQRNSGFGAAGSWLAADLPVDAAAAGTDFEFGLDLAADAGGNGLITYTKVVSTAAGSTSETVAAVLPAAASAWNALANLSSAPVGPLGLFARTRPRIAVAGGTIAVAWMQWPAAYGQFADVRTCYSRNLGASWSAPVVLNSVHANATRAAYPQLVSEPDRTAVVWDERRHWTPPGGAFDGHGAPESFVRIVTTP